MSFNLTKYRTIFIIYAAFLTFTYLTMSVLEAITSIGIYFPFLTIIVELVVFDFSHILNAMVLLVIGGIFLIAIMRLFTKTEERNQAFSFLLVGALIGVVLAGLWLLIMGAHASSTWIGFLQAPDWPAYIADPIGTLGYYWLDDFVPIIWCGLLTIPLVMVLYPKRTGVIE